MNPSLYDCITFSVFILIVLFKSFDFLFFSLVFTLCYSVHPMYCFSYFYPIILHNSLLGACLCICALPVIANLFSFLFFSKYSVWRVTEFYPVHFYLLSFIHVSFADLFSLFGVCVILNLSISCFPFLHLFS